MVYDQSAATQDTLMQKAVEKNILHPVCIICPCWNLIQGILLILAARCHEVGSGYQGFGVSGEKEELISSVKFQEQFVEDFFLIKKTQSCVSAILKKAVFQVTYLQQKLGISSVQPHCEIGAYTRACSVWLCKITSHCSIKEKDKMWLVVFFWGK